MHTIVRRVFIAVIIKLWKRTLISYYRSFYFQTIYSLYWLIFLLISLQDSEKETERQKKVNMKTGYKWWRQENSCFDLTHVESASHLKNTIKNTIPIFWCLTILILEFLKFYFRGYNTNLRGLYTRKNTSSFLGVLLLFCWY